jgi:uncharacterized membrane protein
MKARNGPRAAGSEADAQTVGAGTQELSGARDVAYGLSTARIATLADGIFAIVMTLLIFNLQAPIAATNHELSLRLLRLLPVLFSQVISFGILGVFWFGHHMEFHYIRRADRVLLWLNLFHLLTIALIPFSASLLGNNWQHRTAAVIYGINLFAASLSRYLHWTYATNGHRLVDADMSDVLIAQVRQVFRLVPLLYLVGIVLAFLNVPVSLIVFALLPILYIRSAKQDRYLTSLSADSRADPPGARPHDK